MEKFLSKEIKNMEGTLLGIGITSNKIKEEITKNDNIKNCYLLEETPSKINRKNLQLFNRKKKINIKKIKKVFKKKRIDNIICNLKTVNPFLKTFVRDSVYINKNKLYLYGTKEDYEDITNRYQRYTKNIKIKRFKENFIIIVDNTDTKNNKIKDIIYWWKDSMNNLIDFITTLLVN